MYRATNATFDDQVGLKWSLKNSLEPAYCITQNTDGSTSYLYMPSGSASWLTSAWLGTGQPVVYHAVNYGLSTTDTTGVANQTALQLAITAIVNSQAPGVLFIPGGTYLIAGTVAPIVTGNDPGIIIAGGGGGTRLIQQGLPPLGGPGLTFNFMNCSSGYGIRLQDLTIEYSTALGHGHLSGPAIKVTNSVNVTCSRVFFSNCPAIDFVYQRLSVRPTRLQD
jgi:hypothetical protein